MKNEERLCKFLNDHFNLNDRIEAFKNDKVYSLEIETTSECNGGCSYCYNSSTSSKKNSVYISLQQFKKISKYFKSLGLKEIWWLGGEPCLNPDLFKMIAEAKNKGIIRNVVFTNGLKLNENDFCDSLIKNVDVLVFHFDSISKDDFDEVNRDNKEMPDRYDKTLNGIKNLISRGFSPNKIRHNITLTKNSFNSFSSTLEWSVLEMGFSMVTIIPVFSCGRGKETRASLSIDSSQIKKAFEARSIIENRPELLMLGPSEYCKAYQLTTLYINSSGDVSPYAGINTVVGNAFTEDFKEIITNNIELLLFAATQTKQMNNNIKGKCGKCNFSKYCFGTRTVAYRDGGGLYNSDPSCWM